MRRNVIVLAAVAAAAGGLAIALGGGGGAGSYRVAAVFDTAKGLVPGQQVKIAGAVVGEIDAVRVVPGPRARVVMDIDRRFAPFKRDARCRILPEGLISENFVDCDPGAPASEALLAVRGQEPTVPVSRTDVPTSLQDFVNVFSAPKGERLRVLLIELGLATAGRGRDLNALLRRANPALAQSRRALAVVNAQRSRIARAVGQTDRVLAELAARDRDVRKLVDRSSTVLNATSQARSGLRATIRELPPMLREARAGLRSLDRGIAAGTPLLRDLRASAPGLVGLTRTLPAFSRSGTPALRSLAAAARTGRPAVREARIVGGRLRTASAEAVPFARNLSDLLTSTRDQGGFEGLLRVAYSIAASMAAYDELSHMVGLAVTVLPQCVADAQSRGCRAGYNAPGNGTIPPNSPSCGPQPRATWDPPSDCRAQPAARRRAVDPVPTLDFLLGR